MGADLETQRHQIAIKYKYEGKTYNEIVQIIKNITGETISSQALRNWFMTGGKLFNTYCEHLETQNDLLIKHGRQELKGLVGSAIKVVKDAMVEFITVKLKCPNCKEEYSQDIKIPTSTKLGAATNVLDRELGKAVENINVNVKVGPFDKLKDDELEKRTEETRKAIEATKGGEIKENGG